MVLQYLCSEVDSKQFESDVKEAAVEAESGGSSPQLIEDDSGSSCFVISRTAVKKGKAEDAAKNVRQNFGTSRRRLGSQNAGVEISSTQTFEEESSGSGEGGNNGDDNVDGSGNSNGSLNSAGMLKVPCSMALTTIVAATVIGYYL